MTEQRLTDLAILSIEKELAMELDYVDNFALKKIDLLHYKKCGYKNLIGAVL